MENSRSNKVLNPLKVAFAALMAVWIFGQSAVMAQQPTLSSATALIDRGQPEKALKELATLIATDPRNEKLYYQQGRAYFELEDYSAARISFNRGADLGARYPWNFIGLGSVAAKENSFDVAKANLTKAKELNASNDVKILVGIAYAWLNSSKKEFLSEAEVVLYQITVVEPNNKEAYIGLGTIYDLRNVNELALTNYEKAVELDPKFIYGHLRVGQLKKKIKDYEGAATAFQKAIEIDPTYPPSFREMAEMYNLAGKFDLAKQNMAKYLELMGSDMSALIRYTTFLYYAKEYQNSIDQGRKVLADTTPVVTLRIMAYDFLELKMMDSAMKYIGMFMNSAKETYIIPEDYICYARIYEAQKNVDKAVEYYNKAIQRGVEKEDPRPELQMTIAEVYGANNMYKKQADALERYLTGKQPKLKEFFALGRAYYNDSNWVKSDSVFQKMTESRGDVHLGFLWRGRCNSNMDPDNLQGKGQPHYEKVIEILSKSEDDKVKNKRDYIEANSYMGSYYLLVVKDCAKSRPYWEEILKIDAENKGAKDALKYCEGK